MQKDLTGNDHPGKAPFNGLPPALTPLKALPRWVVWRWELMKNKSTKVPYQTSGKKASSTDPATWSSYDAVIAVLEQFDGIGFCLQGLDLAAFDLDDCRDPTTGEIANWAAALVKRVASYTEITVSGTGLRIIGRGQGEEKHRKQPIEGGGTLETYRRAARYIVMTGNAFNDYVLEDIDKHIDEVVAELDGAKKKKKKKQDTRTKGKSLPRHLAALLDIANAGPGVPTGGYPGRSELLFAFLNLALRAGVDDQTIVAACLDSKYEGKAIYEHVQDNGGEDYIKRQIERALNEDPTPGRQRAIIRLEAGKMDELWRRTERALIAAKCPVFVRGGKLVQPLWRWEKSTENDGSERQVLTTQFVRFNIPRLADVIAHHAVQFQVYDSNKKQWKNIDPPVKITECILEAGHWGLSSVVGIVNSPTMRPDGSLLTQPGYDPATQLWYMSSGDVILPPILEQPTKENAEDALALLNGLLDEFPFEGEDKKNKKSPSRSVALAGIMTTVLRGALPAAVPLFAIVGTEPRTGKTYLITLIALIATGHVPISQGGSEKKEELEKRIETAALTGRPILHLNNLPNGMVVESERLSELSTEGAVYIRKLGRHEEGLCDCRATTMFLNGNNILVAADLVLRTATCRLNPQREDPEATEYKFDPTELVRKDRGRYLAAVFTIARAFIAAGCPRQNMKVVAGFEGWSRLVQQPLIWLGQDDPLGNMDTMRGMDPKEEELQRLLNVLKKYHDKLAGKFTVADCTKLAEEQEYEPNGRARYMREDLRALMYQHGKIDGQHFGRLLMHNRDRVREGWRVKIVASGTRAKAYELVRSPEPSAEDIL